MATRISSYAVTATVIGYTVLYVLGRARGATGSERPSTGRGLSG